MCISNRTQSSGRYVHIQQNTKFRKICAHRTENKVHEDMCISNRTQSSGRYVHTQQNTKFRKYVHIQQNTKFRKICAHPTEHKVEEDIFHIQQNTKFRKICAHPTEHNSLISHMTDKPHPQLDINAWYKRQIVMKHCVCKSIQHHTGQYKVTTKLCCYLLKDCLYMMYWYTQTLF